MQFCLQDVGVQGLATQSALRGRHELEGGGRVLPTTWACIVLAHGAGIHSMSVHGVGLHEVIVHSMGVHSVDVHGVGVPAVECKSKARHGCAWRVNSLRNLYKLYKFITVYRKRSTRFINNYRLIVNVQRR